LNLRNHYLWTGLWLMFLGVASPLWLRLSKRANPDRVTQESIEMSPPPQCSKPKSRPPRPMQALLSLVALAALVSKPSSSLTGLPHSLAEHAAAMAGSRAILPEISDDDTNCGHLGPRALATTTSMMREFAGRDARFATFAGGCFWGLELNLQRTPGVLCTAVGYTQGQLEFPSYAKVSTEATGHTEAVLVLYDRATITYAALAELLFERIGDPTMLNRVGRDQGTQYRTGMYFHSESQAAEARLALEREVTVLRRQTRRPRSRSLSLSLSLSPSLSLSLSPCLPALPVSRRLTLALGIEQSAHRPLDGGAPAAR